MMPTWPPSPGHHAGWGAGPGSGTEVRGWRDGGLGWEGRSPRHPHSRLAFPEGAKSQYPSWDALRELPGSPPGVQRRGRSCLTSGTLEIMVQPPLPSVSHR